MPRKNQFPPSSFSDNGDEVRFHLEVHMENGERKKKGRALRTVPVTKIDPYIRYYILTPLDPFHPPDTNPSSLAVPDRKVQTYSTRCLLPHALFNHTRSHAYFWCFSTFS